MKRYAIFLIALILSSCCTIPEHDEPIIVKEQVLPQEIKFPSVPKVEGIDYSDEVDEFGNPDPKTVYVPADIWVKIAEYMLDVKKAEELYKLFRSE